MGGWENNEVLEAVCINNRKIAYMKELSIVRENLMNEPGYTPYCGSSSCHLRQPRTTFNTRTSQFYCLCGWNSTFPTDFIDRYKEKWNLITRQPATDDTEFPYGNICKGQKLANCPAWYLLSQYDHGILDKVAPAIAQYVKDHKKQLEKEKLRENRFNSK